MYSLGEEGMPPLVSQFGIIDQVTAIMASHQILTALYMRERTGAGQQVHVSILGSATFLLYFNILIAQMGGFEVPRHDHAAAHPMRNHYRCADDRWLDIFSEYDLFCCGVNSFMELENDPQITENGYLTDMDHPTLGKIKIPGYPVHFNGNRVEANRAAPELGEHTDEILTEVGGYSLAEIKHFREDGVI